MHWDSINGVTSAVVSVSSQSAVSLLLRNGVINGTSGAYDAGVELSGVQ